MKATGKIWTIGHSTRSSSEFIELLLSFDIKILIDVRAFPGSRRYPHFNKEILTEILHQNGVQYFHLAELGGRRKPKADSLHPEWKNASFRAYADYMDTVEFKEAVRLMEEMALKANVAYMCSEAVWWRCHRALISDYLKSNGWIVNHIQNPGKSVEHPYTGPAREAQGNLFHNPKIG